ncbi:MAG: alpha-amylase family glycosyl hydrolase [Bacteroidetes bacterium]|nr:alpha-amylase family glycosyl hydrolase [Bacteroidota bacterium]
MKKPFIAFFLLCQVTVFAQNVKTPLDQPPAWAKSAIWYQIFVERFNNEDKKNDPGPGDINIPPMKQIAPAGWSVTPWTHNWFEQEDWAKATAQPFMDNLQYRRFGGDLQGVLNKLDYLKDLGINAIFINPINDAPSLHKYDARCYHHVDVNFGTDPEGDKRIISLENPADPASWQWTSADKLFLQVVAEAHKRGMKVILDYSWNHTGVMFWAWQDILKKQSASVYKDWYDIISFDDPSTPDNEFRYRGWVGIESLPEIKKVNVTTKRENGHPYEGDINPGAKQHIFAVTKRWLAPDGDNTKGIDGFRMDVADQIGLVFWRDWRKFVRSVQPDAYLIGEIWWEQWPDQLMNPAPYTKGDVFDAVMFYQVYRPARYFFARNDFRIDARQLRDSIELQWNRLRPENLYAMMNVSSSHDAPRLLTDFYNPNKYKYHALPRDDSSYKTGKPDPETYKRLRLYLLWLFTTVGAPQIWNGEEMGMWGEDDPDCRKPLWWKEDSFDPEYRNNYQRGPKTYDPVGFNQEQFDYYRKLVHLRKDHAVLSTGKFDFLLTEGSKLAYKRSDDVNELIVLINAGAESQTFALEGDNEYTDILNNKSVKGNHLILEPFTAMILQPFIRVASGRVQRFENFPSKYIAARVVDVWLPDGYSPEKKYAVLYMHDGQMLFDSTNSWNHQEWGVDETAGMLMKKKKIRDCLVVGIWNGGKLRHSEFFPKKPFESLTKGQQEAIYSLTLNKDGVFFAADVQSDKYLKFIVKELKPFIDSAFSTNMDRGNTFIAGSSMGGLISLYAICEYPDVFGGAACLSTHWPGILTTVNNPIPDAFMKYLNTWLPDPSTHKIYFDYGDQTLDSIYKPYQVQADAIMKSRGYTATNWMTREFPGENHSEKSWAKRLHIPLEFLLRPAVK